MPKPRPLPTSTTSPKTRWIVLFIFICVAVDCSAKTSPPFVKVDVGKVPDTHQFVNDGYKSLLIDDDLVYVGSKERLYVQSLKSINENLTEGVAWPADEQALQSCRGLGQQQNNELCNNYIRNIIKYNDTHMFLCGTMGSRPENAFYNIETGSISPDYSKYKGGGVMCSWNVSEPITSLVATRTPSYTSIVGTSRSQKNFQSTIEIVKRLEDGTVVQTKNLLSESEWLLADAFGVRFESNRL